MTLEIPKTGADEPQDPIIVTEGDGEVFVDTIIPDGVPQVVLDQLTDILTE